YAIYKPYKKAKGEKVPIYDWILMIVSAATYVYFVINAQDISSRMTYIEDLTGLQMAIGVIGTLVLIEATRRVVGNALVVIIVIFVVYGLWGQYLPSLIAHNGFDLMWIIDHLSYTTSVLFSSRLSFSLTYIFTFLLFVNFIEVLG